MYMFYTACWDGGGGSGFPVELPAARLRATVRAQLLWEVEIGKKLIQEEFYQQLAGNSLADLETLCFVKEETTKMNTVKGL